MSTRHVTILSLQSVSMADDEKTIRIRRGQASRLRTVRMAAGYTSMRAAALDAGWPESTYKSHENGSRQMDPEDAARYVLWFLKHGARDSGENYTGRWIIYGEEDELTEASLDDMVKGESPAFKARAIEAILNLKRPKPQK